MILFKWIVILTEMTYCLGRWYLTRRRIRFQIRLKWILKSQELIFASMRQTASRHQLASTVIVLQWSNSGWRLINNKCNRCTVFNTSHNECGCHQVMSSSNCESSSRFPSMVRTLTLAFSHCLKTGRS